MRIVAGLQLFSSVDVVISDGITGHSLSKMTGPYGNDTFGVNLKGVFLLRNSNTKGIADLAFTH